MSKPRKAPTLTAKEIRELLGVAERTMTRWFDQGLPCERDVEGRSPVVKYEDLLKFLYKREPVGENVEGSDSPGLERKRIADAIRAERRNAEEEGLLMRTEDAKRQAKAIAHALRAQIEPLVRLRPEFEREVREALERAAKQAEKELGG